MELWSAACEGPTGEGLSESSWNEFGRRLEREQKFLAVNAFADSLGSLRLNASFVRVEAEELKGTPRAGGGVSGWRAGKVHRAGVRPLPGGTWNRSVTHRYIADLPDQEGTPLAKLVVTNNTGQDVYLTVLSVTEERDITVIRPPMEAMRSQLAAGDKKAVFLHLEAGPNWVLDRPLRDRYLVIATLVPADFRSLLQGRVRGDALTGVPPELEHALAHSQTRGGESIAVDPNQTYGVTALDVLVNAPRRGHGRER